MAPIRHAILLSVWFIVMSVESAEATSFRRRPMTATNSTTEVTNWCPPRRRPCTKDCGMLGFMLSEDGCTLCACKARLDCPEIECPEYESVCPFGRQQDENGCSLCGCNEPERCPRRDCSEVCPHGHLRGSDGCLTCQCVPPPRQNLQRFRKHLSHHRHSHRRHGRYHGTDDSEDDGAQQSAASAASEDGVTRPAYRRGHWSGRQGRRRGYRSRTTLTCSLSCSSGFKRDRRGCALCECNDVTPLPSKTVDAAIQQCPESHCERHKKCEHGFAVDKSSGCFRPTCECRELEE